MSGIFLSLVNMSINASWIVLIAVLIRVLFKKAPKYMRLILWGFVGLRLILPFSVESILSLIPARSAVGITDDNVFPVIDTGYEAVDAFFGAVIDVPPTGSITYSPFSFADFLEILSYIWIAGAFLMFLYFILSFLSLKRKVKEKIEVEKGIYVCDSINSPFILGIIKPLIILPSCLAEKDREYVISHEKTHIKRFDHLFKPFGFLLLTVYWFNPVMWIAYYLLCRDIELSCDEKVIKDMSKDDIKGYTTALLNCSVRGRSVAACPLAFGEVGVKERIKTVLNYKKPAFWVILTATITLIAVAVGFLTDPPVQKDITFDDITVITNGSDYDKVSIEITEVCFSGISPYIKVRWINNGSDGCIYGEPYNILQKTEDGTFESTITQNIWLTIAYLLPAYSKNEKIYYLNNSNIAEKGTYRFETCFNVERNGIRSENYTAFIEFETDKGVVKRETKQFEVIQTVFENGKFLYELSNQYVSEIRLSPYLVLSVKENDIWKEKGKFTEMTLSKDNFDIRLMNSGADDSLSILKLRSENKRAWQIQVSSSYSENAVLYVLLEQKDGTLILGKGKYNQIEFEGSNSDSSFISTLYKISEVPLPDMTRVYNIPNGFDADFFERTIAYGGRGTELEKMFSFAVNSEKAHISVEKHLPVYKFESDGDYVYFIEHIIYNELSLDESTDSCDSFLNATRNYADADFYKDNVLIVTYIPDNFAIFKDVSMEDGVFKMYMTSHGADLSKYPEGGYFGIIAISRDALSGCSQFDAVYTSS